MSTSNFSSELRLLMSSYMAMETQNDFCPCILSWNPVGSTSKWPLESAPLFHLFIHYPASGFYFLLSSKSLQPLTCPIPFRFSHPNHPTSIFQIRLPKFPLQVWLFPFLKFQVAPNFLLNLSGFQAPSLGGPNIFPGSPNFLKCWTALHSQKIACVSLTSRHCL